MAQLEFHIKRKEKIESELEILYNQEIDAGTGSIGDIRIRISQLERLLEEVEQKVHNLQVAKLPNQLNVKIFVITNFSGNIKKFIPETIFSKIPTDRNPNDNIENWIPYYDSKKTIKLLLDEFKEVEGFEFNVIYLTGHEDKGNLEGVIDRSIMNKSAIGIIDILSVNEINRDIVKRFDTEAIKSTILPICRNLPTELQEFMNESQKSLFSLSNNRYKNELCCFFIKSYGEDELIQQLRRVYSSNWKIKNYISDLSDNKNDFGVSNFI